MRIRSAESIRMRPWSVTAPGPRPRPLWLQQALDRDPGTAAPTLDAVVSADVCIVGGGFTGLWTAVRLLEADPSLSVVVVEADICGSGASGRNSGGVGHYWTKLGMLARVLGREDALRLIESSVRAAPQVIELCDRYGVDAQPRVGRSVWAATTRSQVDSWASILRTADALGVRTPYRPLQDEELREMYGPAPYLAGVVQDGQTGVQPGYLVRGLRRVALDLGARIFEQSPVVSIDSMSDQVAVLTERGQVNADQVVLGANAWMAHLPDFRRHVMDLSSDCVATDPIPELVVERGLDRRPPGINSRLMVNYGGVSRDKRIYLGRAGGTVARDARITPEFDRSTRNARQMEADFRYLYPQLPEVRLTTWWSGAVDRSVSGLPWFGRMRHDPRIHFGIGFTGHGVAATVTGGDILASHVLGRDDEWADLGRLLARVHESSSTFPPEPARYLGGRVVQGALYRKETAERDGRRVRRVDAALARLAPGTFVELRAGSGSTP